MTRLFFAVPIPKEHRQNFLSSFQRKNFIGVRFTPEENLHITTHFLGSTPAEKIPEIILKAKEISESSSVFEMKFDSLITIFQKKKPVMIWAQFEETLPYENLCLKFRATFPTDENRKPNPHATLARIRQLKQLPFDLPKAKSFSFSVDQLELFESVTHPDGAKYHLIESWKLRESDD